MNLILKNRTKTDCSIIAAVNASYLVKSPYSYSKVKKIAKSCGFNSKIGIYLFQFHLLIKKLKLPIKRMDLRNPKDMESAMNNGKCLIFLYSVVKSKNGHVTLAFMENKKIKLINPDKRRRTWKTFISYGQKYGYSELYCFEIKKAKAISIC